MAGTSAIVTLLFGGLVPRLVPAALAQTRDRPTTDGPGEPLGAVATAVSDALAQLRAGGATTYSDAPDIDFAATLARHDAALGLLCRIVEQAATDRRLRRLAGRLAAATSARAALIEQWQADGGLQTAWVVSGSSVRLRFLEASLERDLARLPGSDAGADFVRVAVAVRRRGFELARLQIEQGRDRRLKALATSLAAAASEDVADLEAWWLEHGRGQAATTHPVH